MVWREYQGPTCDERGVDHDFERERGDRDGGIVCHSCGVVGDDDEDNWHYAKSAGFPAGGSGEYDKALNDFEHQSDSEDFPSDHHPKAGEATMSTPASDWHHRDRGGKWTQ